MRLKRLTTLTMLLAVLVCWVLTRRNLYAALLLSIAAAAVLSLILLLCAASKPRIRIEAPEVCAKNRAFTVHIQIRGRAFLGAMRLHARGRVLNLLTGEEQKLDGLEAAACRGGAEIDFQAVSPSCGKLQIEIEQLRIVDPLGLFSKRVRRGAEGAALVLPETFPVDIELRTPDLPDIESDHYSPVRAGDDPSELFGLRDYREGDPLRNIHWKLSEKYDRTVVREASLPVAHSVILMLDNCPTADVIPAAASAACEALISVSQSLADQSISHQIAWIDRETELIVVNTIASVDDLYACQGLLLSARIMRDESGVVARMLEQEQLEYSHMLVFAAQEPKGFGALPGNTTLLLPEEHPAYGLSCLPQALTQLLI